MARIVVDPVTRIEGHLRVEAEVDGGAGHGGVVVVDDVPRHRVDSARPRSARRLGVRPAHLRRVHHGSRHRLDPRRRERHRCGAAAQCADSSAISSWRRRTFTTTSSISIICTRSTGSTSSARSAPIRPRPRRSRNRSRTGRCRAPRYFSGVRDRMKAFVERGQLGIFANAYWGHPAYRVAAGSESAGARALSRGARFAAALHQDPRACSAARTRTCKASWSAAWRRRSIPIRSPRSTWIPSRRCTSWWPTAWTSSAASICRTCWRSLPSTRTGPRSAPASAITWPMATIRRTTAPIRALLLPTGIIHGRDLTKIAAVDQAKVTEQIAHSWYDYSVGDDKATQSLQRRDLAALYRAEAALRAPGGQPEIQLAEIAAL